MNFQTVQLNDRQLAELANDPQNTVMRYDDGHQLPQHEILDMDKVTEMVRLTRKYFTEFEDMQNEELSARKCKVQGKKYCFKKEPKLRQFAKSHCNIFDMLCKKNLDPKEEEMVLEMIDMFRRKESFKDPKEELQNRVWEKFSVSEEEYEKVKAQKELNDEHEECLEKRERELLWQLKKNKCSKK